MTNASTPPEPRAASRVALVYQPIADQARLVAQACANALADWGKDAAMLSARNLESEPGAQEFDLVVALGGDGTILRAARWIDGAPIPIVGVRMGRLGFLAELEPGDVPSGLRPYADGDYWLDHRAMLSASVAEGGDNSDPDAPVHSFSALNDIVVGHGQSLRTVTLDLAMNGQHVHRFRADGLIVASATGSTAYSFAAGGPVLAPGSRELAVTAICPHISALRSLVVPADTRLSLQVWASEPAVLTVDGQTDQLLEDGSVVEVCLASSTTMFARREPPPFLYSRILGKLS